MINTFPQQSFYVLNIKGEAIRAIFDGDFLLDNVMIASEEFPTDLDAITAMHSVVDYIKGDPDLNFERCEETSAFNPEFFPSYTKIEMTEDQLEDQDKAMENIRKRYDLEDNQVPVLIPKLFDDFGDFITSRWVLKNQDSSIVGKVGVAPQSYVRMKSIVSDDSMLVGHREIAKCNRLQ